jgi:hypothetical protein
MRLKSTILGVLLAAMGLVGCGASSAPRSSNVSSEEANYPAQQPTAGEAWFDSASKQGAPPAGAPVDGAGALGGDMAMRPAEPAPTRPGLGTEWGETRRSSVSTSAFVRADTRSPFATAAMFYNDEDGARAMASMSGFKRFTEGTIDVGGGVATARLKDGAGRFLSGFEAGGKKFMIGAAGDRYSIVIQNHAPARLEIVVSVDGLDVLDGQEASFAKRGYIIGPQSSIEIDGFRQSTETVAAFRFGSVKESYAEKKHGTTRNVGVIGVAVFNEQGTNPSSWPLNDANQRLNADPFPGRFATPP